MSGILLLYRSQTKPQTRQITRRSQPNCLEVVVVLIVVVVVIVAVVYIFFLLTL